MSRQPPINGRQDRPGQRATASGKHISLQSSTTNYTQYTQYTNETASNDIHTMLALTVFPTPPATIPSPTAAGSSARPFRPPSSFRSASRSASHATHSTDQDEEILQDHFIARLLQQRVPSRSTDNLHLSPSLDDSFGYVDVPLASPYYSSAAASRSSAADYRLRFVPTSPTLTAHTHRTSVPAAPLSPPPPATHPVPPLPSPIRQAYFPTTVSSPPVLGLPPEVQSEYSSPSQHTDSNSNSLSHPSRSTHIVRVEAPPAAPAPPGITTVVGYARAAYIPKAKASTSSTPPPIIIPSPFSPTNLIDLSSPSPLKPAALSPRPSPTQPYANDTIQDTLPPVPSPSFLRSHPPSPRNEAPPNVPEDVLSPDDPGPSTSYFQRDKYKHRISMSSIFSKFSRSTSVSSRHGRFAWARANSRRDLPPLPKRPEDPRELEKQEADMALPALLRRAGFLSQMLDSGKLPVRNSVSTYHGVGAIPPPSPGGIPPSPMVADIAGLRAPSDSSVPSGSGGNSFSVAATNTPPHVDGAGSPWEYSSGQGYVDDVAVRSRTSQSIKSFFTRGTTTDRSGHFNVLDEELQRRYREEIASPHASSRGYVGSSGSHVAQEGVSPDHPQSGNTSEKRRGITIMEQPRPARSIWSHHIMRPWKWKRRNLFAVIVNLALVIAVIATVVALTWDHHPSSPSLSNSTFNCPGNFTGSQCNLDATCSCTSEGTICNPLAVSVSNIVSQTNTLLNATYTPSSVALTMWDMQGSSVGSNCAQQAVLIDVNPKHADEAHTEWARSAVLWAVLQSEDESAAQVLRRFVTDLDFSLVNSTPASEFQTVSSGFIFNFEQMTITAPPVTWRSDAKPPDVQTAEISPVLEGVLDRFYTSASALSAQSSTALQNYWAKDLTLDPTLLPKFVSAFQSAPVLLPFDMTLNADGQSLPTVMQLHKPKTISFPPSLACNPMVSSDQLKALNLIEQSAFGLPAVSSIPAGFDSNCFPTRPTYGVLDVMQLNLPYEDGVAQAPLQAAVLSSSARSRLLIRSGEVLSASPSRAAAAVPSSAQQQASYGTVTHLNHVILNYLKSIPLSQAAEVATFIASVSANTSPPSSSFLNTTSALPAVEVALFGSIGPSDVDHSVSRFSTATGSLFFGSPEGDIFREWASSTATSSISVDWTQSAMAAHAVKDTVVDDPTFDAMWSSATTMISNANLLNKTTGPTELQEVISHFQQLGYLS